MKLLDGLVGFTSPIEIAAAIARRSPDGNLAPQDIEALMTTTSEAQGKVAITAMTTAVTCRICSGEVELRTAFAQS